MHFEMEKVRANLVLHTYASMGVQLLRMGSVLHCWMCAYALQRAYPGEFP